MKKIYLFAAAIAALCACQKNDALVQDSNPTVTITAESGMEASKITMGEKTGTAYPMSFDADEHFYLREVAVPNSEEKETVNHYASSSFTKTDAHNAAISFNVTAQSIEGTYDYVSVYPCHPTNPKTNLDNGVRYGGDDMKNRASYALSNVKAQVSTTDGPDKLTHIYWAYDLGKTAQAKKINLNFQSVVSYGKMTVKNFPALEEDETPTAITITGPKDKKAYGSVTAYSRIMSGRVFKYFHKTTDHEVGDVVPYSGGAVYNYVKVDPKNISFNTKGFDIWFTTLPIKLAAGDSLTVAVTTNKTTYSFIKVLSKAVDFNDGTVSEFTVDYNKCITPYKTLTFDFSKNPGGWPEKESYNTTNDKAEYTYDYVLNGTTYKFTCAPCADLATTSNRGIAWGYDGKNSVNYFVSQSHRFLGLPAIEGYKLVTVKFTQILAALKTARQACVTTMITNQKAQSTACVGGGGAIQVNTQNAEYTFNLTSTAANTRYYFAPCSSASGFNTLTLVYQIVE